MHFARLVDRAQGAGRLRPDWAGSTYLAQAYTGGRPVHTSRRTRVALLGHIHSPLGLFPRVDVSDIRDKASYG